KMEFLGQSQVQTDSLTDDEIQAYFSLRRDQYRAPAVISFIHIFFNVDKRGAAAEGDVRSTLARVRSLDPEHIDLSEFGDRFLLQHRYDSRTEQEVRSEFGEEFTRAIFQLEPQGWHGPVPSGYGLHLVYVHHREDAYVPEWKLLKQRIADDMMLEARTGARELFYTEILRNYQVIYRGEDLNVTGGETGE
ncbi:MAG: peptidyl-prolyl cis-trans isomerase, partial [Bacteroidetes bacterium]|nr:peptidyl-prolyl cis-trans isomerase [Bacteroidota bacterium]